MIFPAMHVKCQELIIKGKIRCIQSTESSTKGAENIVVVPTFKPSLATITASQPSGYFEFNTGVPLSKLQDKIVTLYVVSQCADCEEIAKRVFISEDRDRQNRNDPKQYVTIKDWMLKTNCQKAELMPMAADSILNLIVNQPDQNLDDVSGMTALTGAPVLLNFLTSVTPVAGFLPNAGTFRLVSLARTKMNYGRFLLSSPLSLSSNTGFNFSPSRDISEAMFWNPSAIAIANKNHQISLLTNIRNNVKLGGFYRLNNKLWISAGGIFTLQDERRNARFGRAPLVGGYDILEVDSMKMNLKEYAAFISPVYRVNDKLSLGLSLKSVWQDFNIPDMLFVNNNMGTFVDSSVNQQHFDVDISASFELSNALQIGMNLMNLGGSNLNSDAFIAGRSRLPVQEQGSLGLGLTYKWQRINLGADLIFNSDEFYDAALGINFVPFNNALISAGLALKQLSYSFGFRMKHFRIAYINDNDLLINERRKGKLNLLDGNISGGFVFDL